MKHVQIADRYTDLILFELDCTSAQLIDPNTVLVDGHLITIHQEVKLFICADPTILGQFPITEVMLPTLAEMTSH